MAWGRNGERRVRVWLAGVLGLVTFGLGSCGATPDPWTPAWRAPYGYLPIPDRLELGRARADMQAEDWTEAARRLHALAQTYPEQLDIGFALQDLYLALVERGLAQESSGQRPAPSVLGWEGMDLPPARRGTPGATPDSADRTRPSDGSLAVADRPNSDGGDSDGAQAGGARKADPYDALARRYAEQLHASPSVPNLVLAARVQRDAEQALAWLSQALSLDPTCAWAHYGRAHALLRMRDQYRWRNSREALELALEVDPTHLHARRLEAWMLAQEGAGEPAALAIERWLIATEFDPRVRHEHRVAARLDLARVWLALGATDLALKELQTLEGEPVGRARRLLLLAVARTEKGDIEGALHAVRQASLIAGVGVLPFVQEALLREHWLQDREGALQLWESILAEAEQSSDPAVILQAFRARVVLERGSEEASAPGDADPDDADPGRPGEKANEEGGDSPVPVSNGGEEGP